jgi:V8-like Glu-specific endopeptidase
MDGLLHRSIGAITFLNKNKQLGMGSGVLISPNLVLTVAHNIYDRAYNCENEEFKFYLGADGVASSYYEI